MKIAVILLTCLVGLSCQQRFYMASPRLAHFFPLFYAQQDDQPLYHAEYQVESSHGVNTEEEQNVYNSLGRTKPQNRFLFANPFGSQQPVTSTLTSTTTSYVTVSSVVTTATIQSCVPSLSFSTLLGATNTVFNGPCRRKRAGIMDQLTDLKEDIVPSETQVAETSAVTEVREKREIYHPQLVSSRDEPLEQLKARFFGSYTPTVFRTVNVTATATTTTYSFASAVFRRTVLLGSSLLCLPSGLVLC